MKIILVIVAAIVMTGCATTQTPTLGEQLGQAVGQEVELQSMTVTIEYKPKEVKR